MLFRSRFSELFDQALKIQCVLKGICTSEEFDEFKEHKYYDFLKDNNFTELKDAEVWQNRLNLLQLVDPYIGKYFSKNWVRRNVLQLSDDEIEEMEDEMMDDMKDGSHVPAVVQNAVMQQGMMNQLPPPVQPDQTQDSTQATANEERALAKNLLRVL